jgi:hypothetical protein
LAVGILWLLFTTEIVAAPIFLLVLFILDYHDSTPICFQIPEALADITRANELLTEIGQQYRELLFKQGEMQSLMGQYQKAVISLDIAIDTPSKEKDKKTAAVSFAQ